MASLGSGSARSSCRTQRGALARTSSNALPAASASVSPPPAARMIDALRDYVRAGSLSGSRCETPFLVRVAGPERRALSSLRMRPYWLSVLGGTAPIDESARPLKTEDVG